jgi:hypothetical protein
LFTTQRSSIYSLYSAVAWALVLGCYLLLGSRTAASDYTVAAVCALGLSVATLLLAFGPPLRALLFGSTALPKVLSRSYVLPYEALTILRPLGGGSFGDVLKGRYKQTHVAVKRIRGHVTEVLTSAFSFFY